MAAESTASIVIKANKNETADIVNMENPSAAVAIASTAITTCPNLFVDITNFHRVHNTHHY